jgi:NADPH-ferrihemoprotein reductase
MTAAMAQLGSTLNLGSWEAISQLPQYGTLDDLAAMAVLATLSVLYLSKGTLWNRPDPYLYKMYERPQEYIASQNVAQNTRNIAKRLEQMVSAKHR